VSYPEPQPLTTPAVSSGSVSAICHLGQQSPDTRCHRLSSQYETSGFHGRDGS